MSVTGIGSVHEVSTDDGAWCLRYELDWDGVYPLEWLYCGLRMEPDDVTYNTLVDRAYEHFHERRSTYED